METFLKAKTADHLENELPELLIFHNLAEEQLFIKKTALLPFCFQLLTDVRIPVKNTISDRWSKLLKEYKREPAMDKNEDFEKLLTRITKNTSPILVLLLKDNKLALTYYEMKEDPQFSEFEKLFENGKLLPLSELLMLNRKTLLADILILLPFWYSITFLINIIAFFIHLGKPKYSENDQDLEENPISESPRNNNLSLTLKDLAAELIPPGSTLTNALEEQEARWNTRINPKARKDLAADVNALITDRMRQLMRLSKKPRITRDFLEQTASAFVSESAVLQQLGDQEAFIIYIKLYIINLLLNKQI
jgi:hypothetical protein